MQDIGATHSSAKETFIGHPQVDTPEGKGKVELKLEGGKLSYGLGSSEEGLNTFNDNIQSISTYNETKKYGRK